MLVQRDGASKMVSINRRSKFVRMEKTCFLEQPHEELLERQASGADTYYYVNEVVSYRRGEYKAKEVRAILVDIDNFDGEDFFEYLKDFELYPSRITCTSPGHYHLEFFVEKNAVAPKDYKRIALRFAKAYNADKNIAHGACMSRVPGTINQKCGFRVIVDQQTGEVFSRTEIEDFIIASDVSIKETRKVKTSSEIEHEGFDLNEHLSGIIVNSSDRDFLNNFIISYPRTRGERNSYVNLCVPRLIQIGFSLREVLELVRKAALNAGDEEFNSRKHSVKRIWWRVMGARKVAGLCDGKEEARFTPMFSTGDVSRLNNQAKHKVSQQAIWAAISWLNKHYQKFSIRKLAEITQTCKRTVSKHLKELESRKLVTITRNNLKPLVVLVSVLHTSIISYTPVALTDELRAKLYAMRDFFNKERVEFRKFIKRLKLNPLNKDLA